MDNQESKDFTEYGVEEEVSTAQVNVIDFFKKNIYEIAIGLLCIVRIIAGLAPVQLSGKTIVEIIGDSFLTIIFAVLLARLFEEKGLAVGEQAENYRVAIQQYRETESTSGKYIKKLDEWCKGYSLLEYKNMITSMLFPLGLTYEQYKNGEYDESKFSKWQIKQLQRIKKTKMYVYTTEELMSGSLEQNPNQKSLKASKRSYRKRSTSSDFGSKIMLALVFGVLTLPPIIEWNWGGMLWTLVETIFLFAFSVIKYFNAYTFVEEELCGKIVCKTMILNRFIEEMENENNEELGNG